MADESAAGLQATAELSGVVEEYLAFVWSAGLHELLGPGCRVPQRGDVQAGAPMVPGQQLLTEVWSRQFGFIKQRGAANWHDDLARWRSLDRSVRVVARCDAGLPAPGSKKEPTREQRSDAVPSRGSRRTACRRP